MYYFSGTFSGRWNLSIIHLVYNFLIKNFDNFTRSDDNHLFSCLVLIKDMISTKLYAAHAFSRMIKHQ